MSEEIKAKVVEGDNPSIAEKETKVLKKMGLDTGTETVTKVDLRKPKEEKDAIQEQSTDEVPVRDEPDTSEGIPEQNVEEPVGEPTREEEPVENDQPVQEDSVEPVLQEITEEEVEEAAASSNRNLFLISDKRNDCRRTPLHTPLHSPLLFSGHIFLLCWALEAHVPRQ